MTDRTRFRFSRTMGTAVIAAVLLAVSVTVTRAQSAAPTAPRAAAPFGNAAQLMRGIFFPNSNLIFTVQTHDPAAPPKPAASDSQSNGFSFATWGAGIYTGWQVVDNAAVALIDVSPLLLASGLKCENGREAPVTDPEWIKATNDMIDVAKKIYAASRDRNRELVSELTGDLSDSCAACHRAYRDVRPPQGAPANPGAPNPAGRCQSRIR
jgi:hypothetical protein